MTIPIIPANPGFTLLLEDGEPIPIIAWSLWYEDETGDNLWSLGEPIPITMFGVYRQKSTILFNGEEIQ